MKILTSAPSRSCVTMRGTVHYATRRHSPPPSEAKLRRRAHALADAALESSTCRNHASVLKHWRTFITIYSKPDLPSVNSLCMFIAYAQTRVKHVDKLLTALAWHYKPIVADWTTIRAHPLVVRCLHGSTKANASTIRQAQPFAPANLSKILCHAVLTQKHDDLLVACIAVVAFCCCMRLGELVEPSAASRNPRKYCRRDSVRSNPRRSIHFTLPFHKADRFFRSSPVTLTDANACADFNPVLAFVRE